MPHLNDDIDFNLKENNLVTCLIIRNKLTEDKYKNEKFYRNDFLELSFKNSIIKNAKQFFISYLDQSIKIPFILGIKYPTLTNPWIDQTKSLMLRNSDYMNESVLINLIKDLHINEYDSLDENDIYSYKTNDITLFSYEK